MKRYRWLLAPVLIGWTMFAGSVGVARAADLPRADAESVGLDSSKLSQITQMLQDDVAHHVLPGAVLLIARHGKVAYQQAVGQRDPQANAPIGRDDIFRVYSMSKPITVVAALMLVEQGKIALDEPVAKYLPQFAHVQVGVVDPTSQVMRLVAPDRPMTVQDLMRHTSGLTYGFFGDTPVKKAYLAAHLFQGDFDNATFVGRLAKLPLAYQPGTTWDYSHSIDVLGRIVEVVSGKSLYQFEKDNLLDPLGMTDTGFDVTDTAKQGRIAEPFQDDRSFGADATMNDPRQPRSLAIRRRRHGLHHGGLRALSPDDAERRNAGGAPLPGSADGRLHDRRSARHCEAGAVLPSRPWLRISALASLCAPTRVWHRFPAMSATGTGAAPAARICGSIRPRTCLWSS